ncbi:MAG: hypothetical protein KDB00_16805 [Planctomycetales bacterium]|nr:hypothetical protein [Planctomycetales bacterium]
MSSKSIVCPFCPLNCDDVVLDGDGTWVDSQCDLAAGQFKAVVTPSPARIGDQTCERIDWESLRHSLSLPDVPTVELCDAAIGESKSLEALVAQGAIRIHIGDDESDVAMDQAIGRDGLMAATLGDVIRHAEFIWIIGDIGSATPRLSDRLRRSNARLESTRILSIELLSQLHHLLGETNSTDADEGPRQDSSSAGYQLFRQVRRSRYTAIVLGHSAFEPGCEVSAAEMLTRWMQRWNNLAIPVGEIDPPLTSRVVMLRFTRNQNLRSVMRWRNNYVSRSHFSTPSAASIRIGGRVSTIAAPIELQIELQIGGEDPGPANARVYLPASIPGVHFSDTTIRGDGSVTLPLLAPMHSDLPSRIEVLRRVLGTAPE